MADADYQRLGCGIAPLASLLARSNRGGARPGAGRKPGPPKPKQERKYRHKPGRHQTHCDHLKPKFQNGKDRKFCFDCAPKPEPKPRKKRKAPEFKQYACVCADCSKAFSATRSTGKYCSDTCRSRGSTGSKPRAPAALFSCLHCNAEFKAKKRVYSTFCSRECSFAHRQANKKGYECAPLCTYMARYCESCGEPGAKRRAWSKCQRCVRHEQLERARRASREAGIALHRAAAKVVECDECGTQFCPLYGSSLAKLCQLCVPVRERAQNAIHRAKRKALERTACAEAVDPIKVFKRDGWLCRLCGIQTPRSLRGSYEHNAPELDHVHPLSKGGAHSYANTQCLCRSCNSFKADRTMEEVLALLSCWGVLTSLQVF